MRDGTRIIGRTIRQVEQLIGPGRKPIRHYQRSVQREGRITIIDPLDPIVEPDTAPQPPVAGVRTLFTVFLKRFSDSEAMDIIDGMRKFPGYEGDEPVALADISEYRYWSTETPSHLYEWMHDLLRVRYAVGELVVIQLQDTTIDVLNKKNRFTDGRSSQPPASGDRSGVLIELTDAEDAAVRQILIIRG